MEFFFCVDEGQSSEAQTESHSSMSFHILIQDAGFISHTVTISMKFWSITHSFSFFTPKKLLTASLTLGCIYSCFYKTLKTSEPVSCVVQSIYYEANLYFQVFYLLPLCCVIYSKALDLFGEKTVSSELLHNF